LIETGRPAAVITAAANVAHVWVFAAFSILEPIRKELHCGKFDRADTRSDVQTNVALDAGQGDVLFAAGEQHVIAGSYAGPRGGYSRTALAGVIGSSFLP
jgi:hypothetical protein